MMFSTKGYIEVFKVQAEPQFHILLAAVEEAIDPLCGFTFFDLCHNVIFDHLV